MITGIFLSSEVFFTSFNTSIADAGELDVEQDQRW
jgi:hypothetical protein